MLPSAVCPASDSRLVFFNETNDVWWKMRKRPADPRKKRKKTARLLVLDLLSTGRDERRGEEADLDERAAHRGSIVPVTLPFVDMSGHVEYNPIEQDKTGMSCCEGG